MSLSSVDFGFLIKQHSHAAAQETKDVMTQEYSRGSEHLLL